MLLLAQTHSSSSSEQSYRGWGGWGGVGGGGGGGSSGAYTKTRVWLAAGLFPFSSSSRQMILPLSIFS